MQVDAHSSIRLSDRLKLFPDSTTSEAGSLFIAGHDLASLAADYGTPLYIYDRATLNASAKSYTDALSAYYPARSHITYGGKAFLCKAIAAWTQEHGFYVDCTGDGEITIAVAANVKREHILVHGVNKSEADLRSALQHAGTIVVDNLTELKRIHVILQRTPPLDGVRDQRERRISNTANETLRSAQSDISLWLRLLPGVTVRTHHVATQTGQHDSKFGMTREELMQAAQLCKSANLPLNGIHFHQGSNFRDPEPLIPAIEMALDLAKEIGLNGEWHFSPGGGWGVAYHEDELPNPSIESYVRGISESVIEGCQQRGLGLPHLHLEPGRSLVARAGVALYHVGAVKQRGAKTWLLIDGGMADNPRFALYGTRYSCLPVSAIGLESEARIVSIGGPYCESGDILIENLLMPEVHEGDVIGIPVAGAYHLSMASNYNGARRPAVLMLEEGKADLILRRETIDDLLLRDLE